MADLNAAPDPATPPVSSPAKPVRSARRPDPGSRYAAMVATILSCVLIPAVVLLQQCESAPPPAPGPAKAASLAGTPETEQFAMVAKVMVKMHHFLERVGTPKDAAVLADQIVQQLDQGADPGKAPVSFVKHDPRQVRLNRLRAAIAVGEIRGGEQALERIEALAAEPEPADEAAQEGGQDEGKDGERNEERDFKGADLNGAVPEPEARPEAEPESDPARAPAPEPASSGEPAGPSFSIAPDLETLRLIYSGRAGEVSEDQRAALVERHGWLGRLALSHAKPDAERSDLLQGGGTIIAVAALIGFVLLFGGLASITAFIVLLVQVAGGRLRRRFAPPAPGGSVYLETLMLFVLGFVVLKVGGEFAVVKLGLPDIAIIVAQWLLLAVPFWPLVRGVSFAEHRRMIGWHSGAGVFREIGAGIFGYLAGLVPLFFAMLFSMAVLLIKLFLDKAAGRPAEPPKNPVVEHLLKGGAWEVAMLGALATIWAPIVEEAIFRGALFRHLRARRGLFAGAAISAVVFGVMHPYPFFLLLPVITLGFVFAMLREWRGSLIAPITAHALHNGMLVTMLVLVLSIMKD